MFPDSEGQEKTIWLRKPHVFLNGNTCFHEKVYSRCDKSIEKMKFPFFHLITLGVSILILGFSLVLSTILKPFSCGCCILDPWSVLLDEKTTIVENSSQSPWKGLVFFPRHGETSGRRTDILRQSISTYNPLEWDCILFYYGKEPPSQAWITSLFQCTIIHKPGLAYGHWMQMITPELIKSFNYTHICVHINDVQYQIGTNPSNLVNDMQRLDLDVVSPNIIGSYWSSMCKDVVPVSWYEVGWLGIENTDWNAVKFTKPISSMKNEGNLVQFIEIQVTVFTSKIWECWWDMLNPELNPYGWNYDQCFFEYCKGPKMGILREYTAIHWGKYPEFMGGISSTILVDSSNFNQSFKGLYRKWLFDQWKLKNRDENNLTVDGLCWG